MFPYNIFVALFLFSPTTMCSELRGTDKLKSQNTTRFLSSNTPDDEERTITPAEGILLEDTHSIQVTFGSGNFSRSDQRAVQYTRNWQRALLRRTNTERQKANLRLLRPSTKATATAQNWAATMAADEELKHNPTYFAGCSRGYAAENVAYHSSSDVKYLVVQWMNSRGHRENILNNRASYIGVGVVKKDGIFWGVQVFCSNK